LLDSFLDSVLDSVLDSFLDSLCRISKYLAKLENKSADEAWDQALIDIDRTS